MIDVQDQIWDVQDQIWNTHFAQKTLSQYTVRKHLSRQVREAMPGIIQQIQWEIPYYND